MQARQIKWLPVLMAITIAGIAAFQLYWLKNTYEREAHILERSTNMTFRETVQRLQAAQLKLDGVWPDTAETAPALRATGAQQKGSRRHAAQKVQSLDDKLANLVDVLSERLKDTGNGVLLFHNDASGNAASPHRLRLGRRARLLQFLYAVDSLQDTLTLTDISTAFRRRLKQQAINLPFTVSRSLQHQQAAPEYNTVTLGFTHPVTYRLALGNTTPYLAKRMWASLLLSVFIVGITILSFLLLYRNLLRQRRLAEIKNEFISNITHELKTPIATVSVAIEALRAFNADMAPEKSKEYLDISANELQRLSLLVDKVLKLSMFEKKEIELRYEPLALQELVAEVTTSMRLQSDKYGAAINVASEGDTTLQGDRLHLVSVIFNLLDNALKYSTGAPQIQLHVSGEVAAVRLAVTDNGIGIPVEYRDKVFDKFFRVPTGNLHNTKGYGLGLSYVAHVVRKHRGTIAVAGAAGGGTRFVITLPKNAA